MRHLLFQKSFSGNQTFLQARKHYRGLAFSGVLEYCGFSRSKPTGMSLTIASRRLTLAPVSTLTLQRFCKQSLWLAAAVHLRLRGSRLHWGATPRPAGWALVHGRVHDGQPYVIHVWHHKDFLQREREVLELQALPGIPGNEFWIRTVRRTSPTWNSWSSFLSIQSVTWARVTSLSPSLGRAFSSRWGGVLKPYLQQQRPKSDSDSNWFHSPPVSSERIHFDLDTHYKASEEERLQRILTVWGFITDFTVHFILDVKWYMRWLLVTEGEMTMVPKCISTNLLGSIMALKNIAISSVTRPRHQQMAVMYSI